MRYFLFELQFVVIKMSWQALSKVWCDLFLAGGSVEVEVGRK